MPPPPVLRFAPSPNGFLHLGHAYSALANARVAARLGGTLRLRFEDIDPERCRPVYAVEAMADLAWLGVAWQGPATYQSARFSAYRAALAALEAAGLLYPCFCSRGEVARAAAHDPDRPRDPDGAPLYPGTCRSLTPAERATRIAGGILPAWRLDMAAALRRVSPQLAWTEYGESPTPCRVPAEPGRWGDAVLARKAVPTSYHLAVVVDDAAQGITDVVRGADLHPATGLHRLLQILLSLPEPAYHHHAVVRGPDGEKLSKSRKAPALREMRLGGVDPAEVRRRLGIP